jgi:hypothetical protein
MDQSRIRESCWKPVCERNVLHLLALRDEIVSFHFRDVNSRKKKTARGAARLERRFNAFTSRGRVGSSGFHRNRALLDQCVANAETWRQLFLGTQNMPVLSVSAATVFTYTGKCGSVLMAGSTALRNRGGFGGTSHSTISWVYGSSDTSCIKPTDFETELISSSLSQQSGQLTLSGDSAQNPLMSDIANVRQLSSRSTAVRRHGVAATSASTSTQR